MLFAHIYIDNFFSFEQASLDLTYQRPILHSTIDGEWLYQRPKFYIKKVCILSGANASGKTSLGAILNFVQNFVASREYPDSILREHIYHKDKTAQIRVEFATTRSYRLHRLQLDFLPKQAQIAFTYAQVAIGINDSVSKVRKRLDDIWQSQSAIRNTRFISSYQHKKYAFALSELFDELKKEVHSGWLYVFSNNESSQNIEAVQSVINPRVLKAVLTTFDKSIVDVLASRDDAGDNGFSIKFGNHDSVLMNLHGKITNPERLSKGTFDAIVVAEFVSRIMQDRKLAIEHTSDTYYLDEKMAFAHSELEQAILNLIIEKLRFNSQFFYTTHNYDILEMNLPIHSYVFLKKDGEYSQFVQPEKIFRKNDRKLLNYVKNDLFRTLPDTTAIDELLD